LDAGTLGRAAVCSRAGAVAEVDHAVAETALAQQLELHADVVGEALVAAAHHDGRNEQVDLVDQASPDRLAGEVGTANGEVSFGLRFHLRDRFRVEGSLDPRPGARYRLQSRGVHDLVGRLPDL